LKRTRTAKHHPQDKACSRRNSRKIPPKPSGGTVNIDEKGVPLFTSSTDGKLFYLDCPLPGCGKTDFKTIRGLKVHITGKLGHAINHRFQDDDDVIKYCGRLALDPDELVESDLPRSTKTTHGPASTPLLRSSRVNQANRSRTIPIEESPPKYRYATRNATQAQSVAKEVVDDSSSSDSSDDSDDEPVQGPSKRYRPGAKAQPYSNVVSDPLHQQKALLETLTFGVKRTCSASLLDESEYKVEKENDAQDQDSSVVTQNPTDQGSNVTQNETPQSSPDAASQLQQETPHDDVTRDAMRRLASSLGINLISNQGSLSTLGERHSTPVVKAHSNEPELDLTQESKLNTLEEKGPENEDAEKDHQEEANAEEARVEGNILEDEEQVAVRDENDSAPSARNIMNK